MGKITGEMLGFVIAFGIFFGVMAVIFSFDIKSERSKQEYFKIFIQAFLFTVGFFFYHISNDTDPAKNIQRDYKKGYSILAAEEYTKKDIMDAHTNLISFSYISSKDTSRSEKTAKKNCPHGEELSYFASAMYHGIYHEYTYTVKYLDKIPDDYNGPFNEKILIYKKIIKHTLELEKDSSETISETENDENTLAVGDPEIKIKSVYGEIPMTEKISLPEHEGKLYIYGQTWIFTDNESVIAIENNNYKKPDNIIERLFT